MGREQHVKHWPGWVLCGLATASWAAVIAADALNWPEHLWECSLAVALVSLLALLQMVVLVERNRIMSAVAKAALMRQEYENDPTGPHRPPLLRAVRGGAHSRHA